MECTLEIRSDHMSAEEIKDTENWVVKIERSDDHPDCVAMGGLTEEPTLFDIASAARLAGRINEILAEIFISPAESGRDGAVEQMPNQADAEHLMLRLLQLGL